MEDLLNNLDVTSTWDKALSNEWGRLAQGNIYGIKHTDTIEFIHQSEVPKDKKETYDSFVCDHRPLKSEQWRVRLVVGGENYTTMKMQDPLPQT